MSSRLVGVLSLCFAALPVASAAVSSPRHVELRWGTRDLRCIDAEELTRTVERTLGRPVFRGLSSRSASIEGGIEALDGDRFRAHILLRDADGVRLAERSVEASGTCRALDESIAVIVVLMIDELDSPGAARSSTGSSASSSPARASSSSVPPSLSMTSSAPSASSVAVTPIVTPTPAAASVASPPPADATSTTSLSHRVTPTVRLGVGVGAVDGLLPHLTSSLLARAEVDMPRWIPIALTVRSDRAASTTDSAGVGGTFSTWRGELSMCPTVDVGFSLLGTCFGIGAGAMTAAPIDLSYEAPNTRLLAYLSALPAASFHLVGQLRLRVEAGLMFMVFRDAWGFTAYDYRFQQVQRPQLVIPTASLTLEIEASP